MPDCQKYTLTVEAFRITREDYAEGDVPKWAWHYVEVNFAHWKKFGDRIPLGDWLVLMPHTPPYATLFSDADFRANFRRVEDVPVDIQFQRGWNIAMNGGDVPVQLPTESNQQYFNCIRGWESGRAELEARR